MSREEDFEQAARHSYDSEMEDLKKWARKHDMHTDVFSDDDDEEADEEEEDEGEEEEYMETLDVSARIELEILLGTGGPAMGYLLYISEGEVVHGCYWYQDWYQEKRRFSLSNSEIDLVCSAYGIDPSYYRVREM